MTSLGRDRRVLRPNKAEWDTLCYSCGKRAAVTFAVRNRCTPCLLEMTEELNEVRRNKPSRTTTRQYFLGRNP